MKKLIYSLLLTFLAITAIGQTKPPVSHTNEARILTNLATWNKEYQGIPYGDVPMFPAYVQASEKNDNALYATTGNNVFYPKGIYSYDKIAGIWRKIAFYQDVVLLGNAKIDSLKSANNIWGGNNSFNGNVNIGSTLGINYNYSINNPSQIQNIEHDPGYINNNYYSLLGFHNGTGGAIKIGLGGTTPYHVLTSDASGAAPYANKDTVANFYARKDNVSTAIPGNYLGGQLTSLFSASVSGWDQELGEQGNVIKVGDTSVMAYTGFIAPNDGTNSYIGIATSTNDTTFVREGETGDGKIIGTIAGEDPSIVYRKSNSTYYLYTEDKSIVPFRNIRGFTSKDRKHWTDNGTAIDIGAPGKFDSKDVSSPTAFIDDNDVINVFYEGRQSGASQYGAIGRATSTDGIHFTKYSEDPVITGNFYPNPTFAYAYACVPDDIKKIGDTYVMSTHTLVNNNTVFAAGLAVSKDLIHWSDYNGGFLQKSDGHDGTGNGLMFLDNGKQVLPVYQSADAKTLYAGNWLTKADYNIGGKPLTTTGAISAGSVASTTSVTGATGTFTGNISGDNYTISGTPATWSLSSGNYMLINNHATKNIVEADFQTIGIVNSNFNSNALQVNAKFNVMTGTFTGGSGAFTANGNQLSFSRAGSNFIDAATASGTIALRGTNTTAGDVPYMTFSNSGAAVTYNMPGLTPSRIMSTDASRNIAMLSQIGVTQGGTGTQTAPTVGQVPVATSTSAYTPTTPTGTGTPVFSASPALTGTPTAPTGTVANTTQIGTLGAIFTERTNAAILTNKTLTAPLLTNVLPASTYQTGVGMAGTDSLVVKNAGTLKAIGANYYASKSYVDGLAPGYTTNATTTGLSSATLNSTYPSVPIGYRVICGNITLGGAIYTKYSSTVWLMTSAPVQP